MGRRTPGDHVQRAVVHDVGSKAWNFLGDRDVGPEVVSIKCRRIGGLMVESE